jgi:hypothetical protein
MRIFINHQTRSTIKNQVKMRKQRITLTLAAALGMALGAQAAVLTVSNNTNTPGQYTDLEDAYDAAADGDTLYLHASPTSYGSLTLEKRLTLMGEGALPNQQVQYRTEIDNLGLRYADFPSTTNASGSRIIGLKVASISLGPSSANGGAIGGLTITRNVINSLSGQTFIASVGNTVTQNIIGNINGRFGNSVISNNIIYNCNVRGSSDLGGNNLVSNNVIQRSIQTSGDLVTNNVFYHFCSSCSITTSNSTGTTFTNNLFYAGTAVTEGSVIYGSNTGTGNLFQQDPQFITPALADGIQAYTYSSPASGPFADLHLSPSSPGANYGTDGADIGLYGGGFQWVDGASTDSRFRYFPMPNQVPYVISMDVLNSTVLPTGSLNVNFNARTQD